jgi:hypothetical protein
MAAAVEEHMHRAVRAAHHDDRCAAEPAHDVVPGGRNLAFVREKDPASIEDLLQLEAIDVLGDEGIAADQPARGVDPTLRRETRLDVVHGGARCSTTRQHESQISGRAPAIAKSVRLPMRALRLSRPPEDRAGPER